MRFVGKCSALLLVVVVVLAWPVGTWLQHREIWGDAASAPDAIYLVAGEKDQDRRVEAVRKLMGRAEGGEQRVKSRLETTDYRLQTTDEEPETANQEPGASIILVGNDESKGMWSREDQRNLSAAEWAVRKLRAKSGERKGRNIEQKITKTAKDREHLNLLTDNNSQLTVSISIVPGKFSGTDGEMEALARYLDGKDEVRHLVVVTSPFHVRRVKQRLDNYSGGKIIVSALPAKECWTDRAPWTVLLELVKMTRDKAGLSRAPLLSRRMKKPTNDTN